MWLEEVVRSLVVLFSALLLDVLLQLFMSPGHALRGI